MISIKNLGLASFLHRSYIRWNIIVYCSLNQQEIEEFIIFCGVIGRIRAKLLLVVATQNFSNSNHRLHTFQPQGVRSVEYMDGADQSLSGTNIDFHL